MNAHLIEIIAVLALAAAAAVPLIENKNIRNHRHEIIAGLLLFASLLLPLHQRIVHDFWFRLDGLLHHEAAEACFVALAIGLLLGKYLVRR